MIGPESQRKRGRPGNPLLGILLIGRGRRTGLAQFDATPNGFLTSLAPLIAFPLVGTVLMLVQGEGVGALTDFLEMLCALLLPAVLSHLLARTWSREAQWLRYATAFNWCQWLMPVVLTALLLLLGAALPFGLPQRVAGVLALGGLGAYALWLHWFLAWRGLELSVWRAIGVVAGTNLGAVAVLLVPRLIALAAGAKG